MLEVEDPDDLCATLLRIAAKSAGKPDLCARMATSLRAMATLIERDNASTDELPELPPGAEKALVELAAALGTATEHAEFLADLARGGRFIR